VENGENCEGFAPSAKTKFLSYFIKFNELLNQIIPNRHMVMHGTVKMTCFFMFIDMGKEIHLRIARVKPSRKKPNRIRCGPTPSRLLMCSKSERNVLFFKAIIPLLSLNPL
jgi:hypothetical protein